MTIIDPIFQAKATVNFVDSRRMQELTSAAVRDSAAMKQVRMLVSAISLTKLTIPCLQISYLTMIFLPASFVAVCLISLAEQPT